MSVEQRDLKTVAEEVVQRWIKGDINPTLIHELKAALLEQGASTRYVHDKSRCEYVLLGHANLQTDKPLSDMAVVAVYQGADGQLWVRDAREFSERFTKVRT